MIGYMLWLEYGTREYAIWDYIGVIFPYALLTINKLKCVGFQVVSDFGRRVLGWELRV